MITHTVYTDGSAMNSSGGWTAVIIPAEDPVSQFSVSGGTSATVTNNYAELMALILAIETIRLNTRRPFIHLYSDSNYVGQGSTEWIHNWSAGGKLCIDKPKQIPNSPLWRRINAFLQDGVKIKYTHVKGHNGDFMNELCDRTSNDVRIAMDVAGNSIHRNLLELYHGEDNES